VDLWGIVLAAHQREAAIVAAENIPGVKAVVPPGTSDAMFAIIYLLGTAVGCCASRPRFRAVEFGATIRSSIVPSGRMHLNQQRMPALGNKPELPALRKRFKIRASLHQNSSVQGCSIKL
jgi:hypothetical protein